MTIGVLTLNVANPSPARAERQLAWLAGRPEQIFVLTETSSSAGSELLLNRLAAAGWHVQSATLAERERGVAVASRIQVEPRDNLVASSLPGRVQAISLEQVDVIGVYVPSRDSSLEKVERKRRFCRELTRHLAERGPRDAIVIGDLNILEPNHRPRYDVFHDWEFAFYEGFCLHGFADAYRLQHPTDVEYSWLDYKNRGYRFDHVFVSRRLGELMRRCEYIHTPRETNLSDHSALIIEFTWPHTVQDIDVAASLTSEAPLSLF